MLQGMIIGHLGADAVYKNENGKEFVSFRVANTDRWTDASGNVNEKTTWVDCIINGKTKVLEYLKKGQMVYASGSISLRVYSSAKEKCMKAGLTINVKQIELLGSKADEVPNKLYLEEGGTEINVFKYYYSPEVRNPDRKEDTVALVSKTGNRFVGDKEGWISKIKNVEEG